VIRLAERGRVRIASRSAFKVQRSGFNIHPLPATRSRRGREDALFARRAHDTTAWNPLL